RGGRGLRNKRKGPIGINRNNDRDNRSLLVLRLGVESLTKLHDIDTPLTQSRADGRSRIGLPSGNLKLNLTNYLLCHESPLLTQKSCNVQLILMIFRFSPLG